MKRFTHRVPSRAVLAPPHLYCSFAGTGFQTPRLYEAMVFLGLPGLGYIFLPPNDFEPGGPLVIFPAAFLLADLLNEERNGPVGFRIIGLKNASFRLPGAVPS